MRFHASTGQARASISVSAGVLSLLNASSEWLAVIGPPGMLHGAPSRANSMIAIVFPSWGCSLQPIRDWLTLGMATKRRPPCIDSGALAVHPEARNCRRSSGAGFFTEGTT